MAAKDSDEPRVQIHQILLLIAAMTGGIWLYESPLKSSRPVAQDIGNKSLVTSGADRVQARLWQDPFEAVETHIKSEESTSSGGSARDETAHSHSLSLVAIEVATSTSTPRDIQILIVLTDGSPYAENRESRLRQRYAVLAGLERAGYVPTDGEHIRYFCWGENKVCQTNSAGRHHTFSMLAQRSQSTVEIGGQTLSSRNDDCKPTPNGHWHQNPVPVEWYQSIDGSSSHVLVFWIKDQGLGVKPLESLRTIQCMTFNAFPPLHATVQFKVIGPRFSGTLKAMLAEDDKVTEENSLTMYSPWATTPEPFLAEGKTSIRDHFQKKRVTFTPTIPTDDQLISALIDELMRRGVSVSDESPKNGTCDHIAVIAEWDTLYGRTLPATFTEEAHHHGVGAQCKQPQDGSYDAQATIPLIHRYSYLRGLDGELPQSKPPSASGSSSDDKASSSPLLKELRQDIERMERPEGRSQLDYVRRLAELLLATDNNLRGKCGLWRSKCHGFKAIGVLGSDVYDKLLILQALKKSFPYVVFFTTDLDARLFHPGELAWTRNLVVASHFDLTLNEKLQGTIPPFRDTYQTATFFTVLRALGVLKKPDSKQEGSPADGKALLKLQPPCVPPEACNFEVVPRVKIHEIGRNGPVDISVNSDIANQTQTLQQISTKRAAPANLVDAVMNVLYATACLLVVVVLLISASASLSGWVFQPLLHSTSVNRNAIATGLVLCLLLLDLLFGGILYLPSDSYEGEPFSFLDGVSIWPSQILRGTVIGLALLFGWWLLYRYCPRVCDDMEAQFCDLLKPPSTTENKHQVLADDMEKQSRDLLTPQSQLSNPPSSIIDPIQQWWEAKAQMFIGIWAFAKEANTSDKLWQEYRKRLHWTWILMRVVPVSVMFWIAGKLVLGVTGLPFTPFRGHVAEQVNRFLLPLAVLGMIGAIFLVLDITQLTSVFIEKLVPKNRGEQSSSPPLTHLRLIEQLTDRIDEFIYFPATLLVLMVMARSEFFDNWDFPTGLIVVIGLSASYVIASALQLRRASECARQQVLADLSAQYRTKYPSDSAEGIQHTIEEVKALSKGAFMPITELPVFRAVTFPTGFYALLTLVETFIKN